MHRQLRACVIPSLASCVRSCSSIPDHKTLHITERITRLLCPSSKPGPRHPPLTGHETILLPPLCGSIGLALAGAFWKLHDLHVRTATSFHHSFPWLRCRTEDHIQGWNSSQAVAFTYGCILNWLESSIPSMTQSRMIAQAFQLKTR